MIKTLCASVICTACFLLCFSCSTTHHLQQGKNDTLHSPQSVFNMMKKVADWQLDSISNKGWRHPERDWTNGALYAGLLAFAHIADDSSYYHFMKEVGEKNDWQIIKGRARYFADNYCVGQMYCGLYEIYHDPNMIADLKTLADTLIERPHTESLEWKNQINLREWAWCDGLFMGPPTLAMLAKATHEKKYMDLTDSLWWKTTDYLYDPEEHLYYRDSRYFDQREKNGQKVFWSRGNGWVMGGLVRVLENMPAGYPDRPRWIKLYKNMAAKIASLQQPDGTWHASLLDPESYPIKETSGTGFYCYALAWGINHHLLDAKKYAPVAWKAWDALVSCVHPAGMLGFAQAIGAEPKEVTSDDTEVYAVGAFLLSGSELIKMAKQEETSATFMKKLADDDLDAAMKQYKLMMQHLPDGRLPRSFDSSTGKIVTSDASAWTSGFYPGTLWYLYAYAHDNAFKQEAEKAMKLLEPQQYNTGTHDLGFMIYCSFGNAYRLTKDEHDKQVLLHAAHSLSTRFNDTVGCIKSWDHGSWTYPVIIDNMMNLELLCWASKAGDDPDYLHMAKSHANTTMKNHFRPDYSSYHVIDYDPHTGRVLQKKTAQGYSDASAWARGQSWGLYGYTMMYRETKDKRYLEQAQHIAHFILNNPNLPPDMIPYWDYDAPDIPNTYRDVSSASVMASALLELSTFTKDKKQAAQYKHAAEKILISLSSPAYHCKTGACGGFLLMHSVGGIPQHSEIDVPLNYADYYFIEALMRYKKWF